jgi:hypothetical protein
MKKRVGITLGLLLSVPAAAGDVYQWVDDNGQRHFADRPPAGARVEYTEVRPATGGEPAAGNGLRAGERARLSEIEKQERMKAAEISDQDKRAAAEEDRREHRAERDARSCASYKQKIRDYERRLRAGCRVSRCNSYNESLNRYKDKAALVCH